MRGRALLLSDRVTRVQPGPGELVRAMVKDQRSETVTIGRDGRYAVGECSCDEFAEGTFCRHLWAVLLSVQQADGPGASEADLAGLRVRPPKARKRDESAPPSPGRSGEPEWMGRLTLLRPGAADGEADPDPFPPQREVCYVLRPRLSQRHGALVVELRQRAATATGWSKPRAMKIAFDTLGELSSAEDRELCGLIVGGTWVHEHDSADAMRFDRSHGLYRLPATAQRSMLERMIATGRCFFDAPEDEVSELERPLRWAGDEPWVLWMLGSESEAEGDEDLIVTAQLRRGGHRMGIEVPELVLGGPDGVLIAGGEAAPFDDREAPRWVSQFRETRVGEPRRARPVRVPKAEVPRFLDRLYMLPHLPEIDLPEAIARAEHRVDPLPHLELFSPGSGEASRVLPGSAKQQVAARLWFAYDGTRVEPGQAGRFVSAAAGGDAEPGGPGAAPDAAERPAGGNDASAAAEAHPVQTLEIDPLSPVTDTDDEADGRRLIRRDRRAERHAATLLASLGFRPVGNAGGHWLTLPLKQTVAAAARLLSEGWVVTADQKILRDAPTPSVSIASGIDWFELRGGVTYTRADGQAQEVALPEVLAAARRGETMIRLGDGSQGLVPEAWLEEHGLLTSLATVEADHLRFRSSQAALLDAMLDERELVEVDAAFAAARQRLREFNGVKPLPAPAGFEGELRPYQREGLGWLAFLRWFGMGGILADDMGLGKTIQVLAMLQGRAHERTQEARARGESGPAHRPSLIVVPRSVVFNWVDEAQRFTPGLRVLAYAGADREAMLRDLGHQDLVVTSYGLLRRDIDRLRGLAFDYAVLDEAQAIKNPASQAAKAARLLRARHRLALTGTPIENHLGDLWSIFEFLNPGMLGAAGKFNDLIRAATPGRGGGAERDNGARLDRLRQVAHALRPFILRRSKAQVLADLPAKTEQTLVCEMEPTQRKLYDELRQYYRGTLLSQLDASGAAAGGASGGGVAGGAGLGRSAFMVLEALLRLRQAACHPGLIDDTRADEPSAKLDELEVRLDELIDEGSKALVFSQFTSMLALVRRRLDARGIRYAYLDGQTRNRKQVVDQFQSDPDLPVFLISLKAGGTGLNLTAAEYVFIMDPWWNPAVEAQAIDRTHRIGQTKPVFAYRMVCEDTVEQRILELQSRKRQLADAVVGGGDESVLRSLSREDLERLLS